MIYMSTSTKSYISYVVLHFNKGKENWKVSQAQENEWMNGYNGVVELYETFLNFEMNCYARNVHRKKCLILRQKEIL